MITETQTRIIVLQVTDALFAQLQPFMVGLDITATAHNISRKGRLTCRTLLHRPQCFSAVRCASVTPRKPVISFLRQMRIQRCRLCGRDCTSKCFTSAGIY